MFGRPQPGKPRLVACLAALLLAANHIEAIKINISLEECFTEHNAEAGTAVAGSFVAIPPAGILAQQREYDLTVTDPDNNVQYQALERTEDKFSFVAEKVGNYKFCLATSEYRKSKRRWHSYRQVFWEVHMGHTVHHDKATDGPELDAMWATVEALDRKLQDLVSAQSYFKNREARHRMTVDSTSWRVQLFAALRALVLMAVCLVQVLVIRHMFNGPQSGAKAGLPQYYF